MNTPKPLVTCYPFSSTAVEQQPAKHYAAGLMDKINRSIPLDREDKNALTHGVNNNSFFKRAIPVGGWAFDFSAFVRSRLFLNPSGVSVPRAWQPAVLLGVCHAESFIQHLYRLVQRLF